MDEHNCLELFLVYPPIDGSNTPRRRRSLVIAHVHVVLRKEEEKEKIVPCRRKYRRVKNGISIPLATLNF